MHKNKIGGTNGTLPKKIVETLANEYAQSVKEVGFACCEHTCNNPLLTKFTSSVLISVPGLKAQVKGFMNALDNIKSPNSESQIPNKISNLKPQISKPAPDGSKRVRGYEMQDVNASGTSSAPIPWLFLIGFLLFLWLIMLGWKKIKS